MQRTPDSSFSLSNIIILGRQGRGATSHVFLAQSTRTKQLFAIKVIDKKSSKYNRPALDRELSIQSNLTHPNIVQLICHLQDNENHYVLTEYCENGQITRLIMNQLPERQLALIALQMTQAVDYLHNNNITHCDIKLSNMLVHQGRIKLCDFGYSQRIDQKTHEQNTRICGTLFYLAPEILKDKCRHFFRQADVWAIGICLLILSIKKQPYSGKSFQQIRSQILQGNHLPLSFVSTELKNFIDRLLEIDPTKRITIKEIKNHPFIIKHNVKENELLQLQQMNMDSLCKVQQKFGILQEKVHSPIKYENREKYKKIQKNITPIQQNTKIENLSNTVQTNTSLRLIQTRMISPLSQFYYQTKNSGFIRIKTNGQLEVKVKGVFFQIISKGEILKLGDLQFHLKDLNQGITTINQQAYQLYQYASKIISIFKHKKYSHCWNQQWKNSDLTFAVNKDNKNLLCLATLETRTLLFQYSLMNRNFRSKLEGQQWETIHEQQQSEDMRELINLIILRSGKLQ